MTTLQELAAATIVTGIEADNANDFAREVGAESYGGYILFAANLRSVEAGRALTDAMRARTHRLLPPIIATDHEGGRVVRLRTGLESLPSAMAMSATHDPTLVEHAGEQAAFDLRRVGFNLDFAPVVDLALAVRNTVIGTRSFGSDPARVIQMAGAFARGLRIGGVIPTPKHFPGHGATEIDSHLALPIISASIDMLRHRDLIPFQALLPGADAVMSAHIVIAALHDDQPVTLNAAVLEHWLRRDAGFDGVLFSDALEMKAIASHYGVVEGAVRALAAGIDALVLSHDAEQAKRTVRAIVSAVHAGRISMERLLQAAHRVQRLRRKLSPPLAVGARPPHPGIGAEIARSALTVIRGDPRAKSRQVITFSGDEERGAADLHRDTSIDDRATHVLGLQPTDAEVNGLLASLQHNDARPVLLMRRAHIYDTQRDAIDRVLAIRPDALLVSTMEPYDGLQALNARHVMCTYGDEPVVLHALEALLDGRIQACGSLPIAWATS